MQAAAKDCGPIHASEGLLTFSEGLSVPWCERCQWLIQMAAAVTIRRDEQPRIILSAIQSTRIVCLTIRWSVDFDNNRTSPGLPQMMRSGRTASTRMA